jgi:hypothetical protein
MVRFAFLLFLFASSVTYAQQGVLIRGLADCGKWISARAAQPASGYYETAIQAYINGLSMASGIDIWGWGGNQMSEQQAYLFVDNYCRKHPLEDIWQAGWMLANEKTNNALINQSRKRIKQ